MLQIHGITCHPASRVEFFSSLLEDACAPSNSTVPQLVPVVITAEQDAAAAQPPVVTEKIEIDVSGKYRIRVACGFDGQALRRVLDVLERR